LSVGIVWLSDWLPAKLTGQDKKKVAAASQASAPPPAKAEPEPPMLMPGEFEPPPRILPPIQEERTPQTPLYCTGIVTAGVRFTAQLSDGRTLREGMDMVESWDGSRLVMRDGSTIWVLPRIRPQITIEKEKVQSPPSGDKHESTEERQPAI